MLKNIVCGLCLALTLCTSLCFATPLNGTPAKITGQKALSKVYISSENIVMQNGRMLITDGSNTLFVKTLHQDSSGLYFYTAGIYGNCPYGHPYGPDGGCYGYNCPFN